MSERLSKHVTVRGAGISIGGARESVGSWSNSHRFIPLKQKVCLRSVAYDTNSGSSSPMVIVTCRQPRPLRSISRAYERHLPRFIIVSACAYHHYLLVFAHCARGTHLTTVPVDDARDERRLAHA